MICFILQAQKRDDNEIMILLNRTTKGARLYWNNTMYSLDKISFLSSPDGQVHLLPLRNNFVHMYFNGPLLDVSISMSLHIKNWYYYHLFNEIQENID